VNNISVGDMAAQIMAQESFSQKKSTTPSKVTFEEDTSFYSPNVTEQSPDISDVEVPTDFVTNLLEGKAPTTSPPPTPAPTAPQVVTTTEPLSEAAPDLQALVQEVRDLISELKNTLVEMTAVGSLGVNMAGPGKKKKEVEEEEEDPMKKILKKIKYRRASK
tara:strand:- start:2181 stop:2666 length:486 start_codon:yes stop_codon:yes gene_type:complete